MNQNFSVVKVAWRNIINQEYNELGIPASTSRY